MKGRIMMAPSLLVSDMHCHVGFIKNARAFAEELNGYAAAIGAPSVLAVSVTPSDHRKLVEELSDRSVSFSDKANNTESVRRGGIYSALGLHPWWVPENEKDLSGLLDEFDRACVQADFIGEVGLDFSVRHAGTMDQQIKVFRHVLERCCGAGRAKSVQGEMSESKSRRCCVGGGPYPKALSIHCVRAYDEALSMLEEYGIARVSACVLHWFSGSSEHLVRAKKMGCYFSVSERMLSSRRGREYAKAIPENRLLLETDAPLVTLIDRAIPSVPYSFEQVREELLGTLDHLCRLRNVEPSCLAGIINENVYSILSLNNIMQ